MSEPRRLIEDPSNGIEADLLRSARWDAPQPASRRKALVALGVGGATVLVGSSTSAATVATATGTIAMAKWIVGGVIAGVVALGVVYRVGEPGRGSPNPSDSSSAAAIAPPRATAAPVAPRGARAEPAATALEAPAASEDTPHEVAATKPSASTSPTVKPASTLADEVASLDAAREALAAGDAARALRAVDDHDRRFPTGAMGPEATVVRIEALALRGDRAAAARMATAFLGSHPASPHAKHLRTLLGLPPPDAP